MQQSIEDGGGHDRVTEHLAPVGKALVRGQDQTGALVATRDQAEEQARLGPVGSWADSPARRGSALSGRSATAGPCPAREALFSAGLSQACQQVVERQEQHSVPGLDRLDARGNGQMGLAHTGRTEVKTITADNGTEFHQYRAIEADRKVRFYFANPYHSWELGSNENANGLIRQYLPRGTSMANLTYQQCDAIAYKINTRPKKRFNFKTPEHVHQGL